MLTTAKIYSFSFSACYFMWSSTKTFKKKSLQTCQ